MRAEYPFSAVVGQDDLKLALLLTAVDPTIGGVLIKGERGTAKTTIARGLATLLPAIAAGGSTAATPTGVRAPFVELPLGATEDRVVGSLDVNKALREGDTQLRSGVLARANGGVLYVDEVNLLPDHLVDLLLDAAATGWVTVERDGVSAGEAARFVLVGTMNPEEGDLRPQFLDRFGLSVVVQGLNIQEERMAAVNKRLEFDANPDAVIAAARPAEAALRAAIIEARARLLTLPVTAAHLSIVTAICAEQSLDGIRGDLAIIKTARALAAWDKDTEIGADHIRRASAFALPHRMRRRPPASTSARRTQRTPPAPASYGPGFANGLTDSGDANSNPGAQREPASTPAGSSRPPTAAIPAAAAGLGDGATAPSAATGTPQPMAINLVTDLIDRESSGRRGTGSVASRRATRVTPYDQTGTLAINETLTTAAVRGRRVGERGIALAASDLMQHGRSGPGRSSVLFLVDASASMATQRRLELAKGAVLGLLKSNYQHRDEVALMVFRGEGVDLVMPFTSGIDGVEQVLTDVPTGGRTPLARALTQAADVLRTRENSLLIVFTDGRANVSLADGDPWQESLAVAAQTKECCAGAVVVDCEPGPIVLGRARQLAAALDAECVTLGSLEAGELTLQIQRRLEAL
jgi:magnesium chelatase subunit D